MAEAVLHEQESHEDYEIRKCVVFNTQAQSLSIVLYDFPDKMKIDYLRCWINFIFLKFKPLPTLQCTMYMPTPVQKIFPCHLSTVSTAYSLENYVTLETE